MQHQYTHGQPHIHEDWIYAVIDEDDGTTVAYRAYRHLDAIERRELRAERQALKAELKAATPSELAELLAGYGIVLDDQEVA